MPSLFSRRYVRPLQAVGAGEKLAGLIILLLLAGIVAAYVWQVRTSTDYLFAESDVGEAGGGAANINHGGHGGGAESADAGAEAANPLPEAGVEGWLRPTTASRFTPETLFQKIDGRADLYLQYHVVGLTFGTYARTNEPDRTIDIYWYDMGEPDNALGAYRAESPEQPAAAGVGQQSYAAEGAVFFLKGGSYVQVLPAFPDAADAAAAREIARRIAGQIEDRTGNQWALEVLPHEGRTDGSLEYLSDNVFGLSFLSDVYTAEYQRDSGRITLFIHRATDEAEPARLLSEYQAYFEQNGEVLWTYPDPARRIIAGQAFGAIDVVFAKGVYFGGAAGAENLEEAKEAAGAFYDSLPLPKEKG